MVPKVNVISDKKWHFSALMVACVRFMFGKTSLASSSVFAIVETKLCCSCVCNKIVFTSGVPALDIQLCVGLVCTAHSEACLHCFRPRWANVFGENSVQRAEIFF